MIKFHSDVDTVASVFMFQITCIVTKTPGVSFNCLAQTLKEIRDKVSDPEPHTCVNNNILHMSLCLPDICCYCGFVVVSSNYKCNCCCCCYCCHLGSLEVTGAPMEAAHPCPHSPCWMGLQLYTSLHIASRRFLCIFFRKSIFTRQKP